MARFSGWTANAVAKLSEEITNPKTVTNYANKNAQKLCKQSPDYVGQIKQAIEGNLFLRCEREYKFLHDRRFRFDLSIPEKMIAIEWEGMIWRNGRHTRGKGYHSDCKKYNLAVMHGWKLLRYTTEDTKHVAWEIIITDEIRKLIGS